MIFIVIVEPRRSSTILSSCQRKRSHAKINPNRAGLLKTRTIPGGDGEGAQCIEFKFTCRVLMPQSPLKTYEIWCPVVQHRLEFRYQTKSTISDLFKLENRGLTQHHTTTTAGAISEKHVRHMWRFSWMVNDTHGDLRAYVVYHHTLLSYLIFGFDLSNGLSHHHFHIEQILSILRLR